MKRILAGLPLLLLLLWLAAPPAAQAAPSPSVAPASAAEMNLYTRIAAVNVCLARAAGVEFDKAAGIAGETIAQLIQGQHGSSIAQVGPKPLGLEELREGSVRAAVIGAVELCPQQVPSEVVKQVDQALKASGATPAAPRPQPPGQGTAKPTGI